MDGLDRGKRRRFATLRTAISGCIVLSHSVSHPKTNACQTLPFGSRLGSATRWQFVDASKQSVDLLLQSTELVLHRCGRLLAPVVEPVSTGEGGGRANGHRKEGAKFRISIEHTRLGIVYIWNCVLMISKTDEGDS